MKIVSWNCNGALRKKLDKLLTIEADVYVIQECEDPSRASDKRYKEWASNYLWRGSNKNKGLGVFAKRGEALDLLPLDGDGLESFIACRVHCRHTLLAVWTREANSPTFKYIGQLWKYLQRHKEYLAKANPWVIGDLNSNACWDVWDRWWNHSDVVRELDEIGIRSLYHHQFRQDQGKESQPTFFLYQIGRAHV
jgi:exonuclease III